MRICTGHGPGLGQLSSRYGTVSGPDRPRSIAGWKRFAGRRVDVEADAPISGGPRVGRCSDVGSMAGPATSSDRVPYPLAGGALGGDTNVPDPVALAIGRRSRDDHMFRSNARNAWIHKRKRRCEDNPNQEIACAASHGPAPRRSWPPSSFRRRPADPSPASLEVGAAEGR